MFAHGALLVVCAGAGRSAGFAKGIGDEHRRVRRSLEAPIDGGEADSWERAVDGERRDADAVQRVVLRARADGAGHHLRVLRGYVQLRGRRWGGLSRVSSSRIGRNVPRHRTFSPSTSLEPLVNDGLGKDCMVLLTCGPKPDTSLYSRRGSGFSYGLRGRWAPMAPWCVPLRRDAMPKSGTIVSRNNRIGNSYDTQLEILP